MPCWTVQTSEVSLDAKTDINLLKVALTKLGFMISEYENGNLYLSHSERINGSFQNGKLSLNYGSEQLAEKYSTSNIKVAYSEQVVRSQAKRFGFTVKQDAKNPNKFQLVKRI